MRPGMTVIPRRSITFASLPASLRICAVSPTATMRAPLTAIACATVKRSSTVTTLPLSSTRSTLPAANAAVAAQSQAASANELCMTLIALARDGMEGFEGKSRSMAYAGNILDLIGNTPLVEVKRLETGRCRLFLKLENQNPGGSIKDRIALSMIEAAEQENKIRPGSLIVEATAGNTGLGLALVAAQKGYRLLIVVPDKMSQEKIFHLRALGAEVRLTRSDVTKGHPEYYQDMAARITRETPGAFYANQFGNDANPLAHETTTGPEIWAQMEHKGDAMVCGVGTGGTITGLSRFFEKA